MSVKEIWGQILRLATARRGTELDPFEFSADDIMAKLCGGARNETDPILTFEQSLAKEKIQTESIRQHLAGMMHTMREVEARPRLADFLLLTVEQRLGLIPLTVVYSQEFKTHVALVARLHQFSDLLVCLGLKALSHAESLQTLQRATNSEHRAVTFVPCKLVLEPARGGTLKSPEWINLQVELENFVFAPVCILPQELLKNEHLEPTSRINFFFSASLVK